MVPLKLILALNLAQPWAAPASSSHVSVWSAPGFIPAEAPASVRRLATLERAWLLEAAGDAEGALALLMPAAEAGDPLAVATAFHTARLRLVLGDSPDLATADLFAPPGRVRLRWGISRRQEAHALLLLADRMGASGDEERAQQLRRRAALDYPRWAPEVPGLTLAELRTRARHLARDMDYAGSLSLFERVLARSPATERVQRLREMGWLIGDKMRDDYPRAADIYGEIVASDEATAEDHLYLAYLAGKLDDAEAVAIYRRFVREFPGHDDRPKASFFVAWTLFDQEKMQSAIRAFDRFLEAHPDSGWRYAVRWYRGLAHFREGSYRRAFEDFEYYAENTSHGAQGRYWMARSLLEGGRTRKARRLLRQLAVDDAFSYYSMMARALLPPATKLPLWSNGDVEPSEELTDAEGRARAAHLPEGMRVWLSEAFSAARLGKLELADALLAHAEQNGLEGREHAPLRRWLRPQLGGAHRHIRSRHARRCRSMLDEDPAHPDVQPCWRALYPQPYARLVHAVRGEVPTALFWSIMRQESFFQPQARSHADALGLMQVIPQVGRPAAKALGRPFAPYELLRPDTNLRYFAHAVRERYQRFGGHLPLVLMSYNATPEKASYWLHDNRELPFDLFVEEIPWSETRNYVKRISSHLARYRTLQGASDQTLLERAGLPHPTMTAGEAFRDLLEVRPLRAAR